MCLVRYIGNNDYSVTRATAVQEMPSFTSADTVTANHCLSDPPVNREEKTFVSCFLLQSASLGGGYGDAHLCWALGGLGSEIPGTVEGPAGEGTGGLLGAVSIRPTLKDDSFDYVIGQAIDAIEKLKVFISNSTSVAESAISDVVEGAYSAVTQRIEEAQQQGKTLGINVSLCVDGKQAAMDANTDNISKAAVECVTSKADEAIDDLETILVRIESAKVDIQEAEDVLASCGASVSCILEETEKVIKKIAELGGSITTSVNDAVNLYNTFPEQVEACEATALSEAQTDSLSFLEELEACLVSQGLPEKSRA
uniref:Uncharacterized protein n=1 Tax=Timema bartmani TaxID=61472 RepID=A0A7R9F5B3_9NEOP|nr:unnamed protein product [Timema bartmani]